MKFLQDRWHFVWCFPSLPTQSLKTPIFQFKSSATLGNHFCCKRVWNEHTYIMGFWFFRSPHLLEFLAPWVLLSDGYRNIWYTPRIWILILQSPTSPTLHLHTHFYWKKKCIYSITSLKLLHWNFGRLLKGSAMASSTYVYNFLCFFITDFLCQN